MFDKSAHTLKSQSPISIARRWSGRAFDPARPVPRGQLIALLEAARWAPSCFGEQPWRYIVWDRFADPHHGTGPLQRYRTAIKPGRRRRRC